MFNIKHNIYAEADSITARGLKLFEQSLRFINRDIQ